MQVPILSGIYTDEAGDFRSRYPRNLVPVPKDNGISKGYLRPADGLRNLGSGPGYDRGGINWNGQHYRVMGTQLVRILQDGTFAVLATVDDDQKQVTFDYSFDRLAIACARKLYYWNGSAISQVTDPDLGQVNDMVWVDGYFMTTDGTNLVVTDLGDPMAVNPLKYGSSEADPDPVVCLVKLRNEVYALNRYTVEVFNNVGSAAGLFPFERIEGAQLQRGAIGTSAACVFLDTAGNDAVTFLGGARNESPAIWLGGNGTTFKISTQEIDKILKGYTEDQLKLAVMEAKVDESHQHLYLHLPDQTLVFDAAATKLIGQEVWFTLTSTVVGNGVYRARNFVWCYNQWNCADPTNFNYGVLDKSISSHYGQIIGWEFGTAILYNESKGAIFHMIELVTLTGRVDLGASPVIWTSWSEDGETFSLERPCPVGKQGDRTRRITWMRQGGMRNWRIQRFRGTSESHLSFARLEITIEPLYA